MPYRRVGGKPPRDPRDRFVEHRGLFAAGETHERRPRGLVVVEHHARHRDHAAAVGQRPAERKPVGLADFVGMWKANNGSNTQTGWTAGAGVEYAFLGNWTAKLEYLYVDLGSSDLGTAAVPNNVSFKENIVRAGLNYKFSGPIFSRF